MNALPRWRPWFDHCAPFAPAWLQMEAISPYLRLFRDFQDSINFDLQVSDRSLQFGTPESALKSSQVLCPLVDQPRLGPAHRMCAIGGGVETGGGNPLIQNPRVLPCGQLQVSGGRIRRVHPASAA